MADSNPHPKNGNIPSTVGGNTTGYGKTLALSEITASMATTDTSNSTPSKQPQNIHQLMATGAMPTFKGQAQSVIEPNPAPTPGPISNGNPVNRPTITAYSTTATENLPIVEAIAYPEGHSQMLTDEQGAPTGLPQGHLVGDGYSTSQSASAGSTNKLSAQTKGDTPKESRKKVIVGMLVFLALLLIAGSIVAGVCLSGNCAAEDKESSATNAEGLDEQLNYFSNLAELQQAVDDYVDVWASSSGDAAVVSASAVAVRYGYPMSTWNVAEMSNFSSAFDGKRNPNLVSTFDEDLSGWNVSRATDMFRMFAKLSKYTGRGLRDWDVRKVTTLRSMFHEANKFVGDVSQWDVSNVVTFTRTFSDCHEFNIDISNWDVSNARDVDWMFFKGFAFNQDLSGWDVANVVGFSEMFQQAKVFNQNISGWNIANAEDMERMFEGAWAFNQDLSAWDVRGVKYAYQMFSDARSFNQSLCSWGGQLVNGINVTGMFNQTSCRYESDPVSTNTSTLAAGPYCHACV